MKEMSSPLLRRETGVRIAILMDQNGLNVSDVQHVMGFSNPQAVYKWMSGKTIPSPEHLVILSMILNVPIDEILVVDKDKEIGPEM